MFDVFSSREKIDKSRIELIDELDSYRKIFSSRHNLEIKIEDLSLDFHNLNDKTRNFIRLAMRHVEELENTLEKDEKSEFQQYSIQQHVNSDFW